MQKQKTSSTNLGRAADNGKSPVFFPSPYFSCSNMLRQSNLSSCQWLFHPGMLFGSSCKWWGTGGERSTPHEGLDFYTFIDERGGVGTIPVFTEVPVLFDGIICCVCDDFLGQTLVVCHEIKESSYQAVATIYSHIEPAAALKIGRHLQAGVVLGTLARPATSSTVPAHLHLSVIGLPDQKAGFDFDWQNVANLQIEFLDPFQFIALSFQVQAESF